MPSLRLQLGAFGSTTTTLFSLASPLFVTLIVQLAGEPRGTVCEPGVFAIVMAGFVFTTAGFGAGASGATVTCAESVAVTSAPLGRVAATVATFVRLCVTFACVQV